MSATRPPTDPVDARVTLLVAEIERDWAEVHRQLARTGEVDPAASGPNAAWVALALDHAYSAFEAMLQRVERALALPDRTGERWHQSLLEEASLDLRELRPAIIPRAALSDWMELLKFRHFLRHAYGADLEAARLRLLAERLTRAVEATAPSVAELVSALRPD